MAGVNKKVQKGIVMRLRRRCLCLQVANEWGFLVSGRRVENPLKVGCGGGGRCL